MSKYWQFKKEQPLIFLPLKDNQLNIFIYIFQKFFLPINVCIYLSLFINTNGFALHILFCEIFFHSIVHCMFHCH